MPDRLKRASVSLAQRVMIPATIVVSGGFGISLVREPTAELLAVPAYRTLDGIATIHAWGWLFLAAALVQVLALLTARRDYYIYTLGVCMLIGGLLTGCLTWGAAHDWNPWTAPWFPLYYTMGCLASARTLEAREK